MARRAERGVGGLELCPQGERMGGGRGGSAGSLRQGFTLHYKRAQEAALTALKKNPGLQGLGAAHMDKKKTCCRGGGAQVKHADF